MKDNSLQLIVIFLLIVLVIINTINLVFSMMSRMSAWPASIPEALPIPSSSVNTPTPAQINSFSDCAAAGYAVMETYPRTCATSDGRSFTEGY